MGEAGRATRRLRPIAILAGLSLLGPAAARAEAPVGLQAAFGNTIVSTYANGDTARLWIDRDGVYNGRGRRGDASRGHWVEKNGKLCFKQARPLPIPVPFCTAIIPQGVGATWPATSVFGEPLSVALVAGR